MKGKWKLNEESVNKILSMYKEGHTKNHIARTFSVDHSTVIYHIKKNIPASTIISHIRIRPKKQTDDLILYDDDGSKINKGKSYEEYSEEEEMKRLKKQSECLHSITLRTEKCRCCGKLIIEEEKTLSTE